MCFGVGVCVAGFVVSCESWLYYSCIDLFFPFVLWSGGLQRGKENSLEFDFPDIVMQVWLLCGQGRLV